MGIVYCEDNTKEQSWQDIVREYQGYSVVGVLVTKMGSHNTWLRGIVKVYVDGTVPGDYIRYIRANGLRSECIGSLGEYDFSYNGD